MRTNDFVIVGVGASAGGLDALRDLFRQIPRDIPAAFIIVTHLSRIHRSELARIMSRFTDLRVEKISRATLVEPGVVFVQPEDTHIRIKDGSLIPVQRPTGQVINRAIDFFFKSLAVDQKQNAIGIVLTGMGSDGAEGARCLYEHGGTVFAQAPSTTSFQSMPCATIMKDHPEFVLPPADLGTKIAKFAFDRVRRTIQR